MTIDCVDPARMARFWSAALGWDRVHISAGGAGATCGTADAALYIEFVRVPEPKSSKNRLHFGCHVESIDQYDDEFRRLAALGASLAWKEVFAPEVEPSYRNWVLYDPEGNEFCLGGGTWPEQVAMPTQVPIEHAGDSER